MVEMSKAVRSGSRKGSPLVKGYQHEVDGTKKKIRPRVRDPLTELNGSSSSSSASTSAETPRGCFRFLKPNSFARNAVSRTPRSAPVLSKPRSRPPDRKLPPKPSFEIPRRPCSLSPAIQPQNDKSRERPHRFCVVDPSHSQRRQARNFSSEGKGIQLESSGLDEGKSSDFSFKPFLGENGTPSPASLVAFRRVPEVTDTPATKLGSGPSVVVSTPETATPPLHASVSPEISSGFNGDSSVTSACFGAGHVLAGVSDKRKCKPRGILTVQEQNETLEFCEGENPGDVARFSFMPAPAEAAMKWIVSPNDGEKYQNLESAHTELHKFGGPRAIVSEGLFTPPTVQLIPKAITRRRSLGFEGLVEPTKLVSEATPPSSGHGYCQVKSSEELVGRRIAELSYEVSNSPCLIASGKTTPIPSSGNRMPKNTIASPEYEGFVDTTVSFDGPVRSSSFLVLSNGCSRSSLAESVNQAVIPHVDENVSSMENVPPSKKGLMCPSAFVSKTPTSNFDVYSNCITGSDSNSSIALTPREEKGCRYYLAAENSPFLCDSWGGYNMMDTPQSIFGSGKQCRSLMDNQSELSSMAESLRAPVGSDTNDVLLLPGLSHEFQCPETSSNSMCKSIVQKPKSEIAFEDASELRISWREGLVSMIYEMDELDCCQWSSEEEEIDEFKSDLRLCFAPIVKSSTLIADDDYDDLQLAKGSGTPDLVYDKQMVGEKKPVISPLESIPCAESINTDGNGLMASDSSDWTLCYKNQLFEV